MPKKQVFEEDSSEEEIQSKKVKKSKEKVKDDSDSGEKNDLGKKSKKESKEKKSIQSKEKSSKSSKESSSKDSKKRKKEDSDEEEEKNEKAKKSKGHSSQFESLSKKEQERILEEKKRRRKEKKKAKGEKNAKKKEKMEELQKNSKKNLKKEGEEKENKEKNENEGEEEDQTVYKDENRKLIHKAKKRKNIIEFNKLIGQFGQKKQFGYAWEAYNVLISTHKSLVKKGRTESLRPTIYTFTSIINACVRCGEMKKAKQFLKEMKEYGEEPNEVTYTVLIKGLCGDADTKSALEVLKNMKEVGVNPNIRTYNTFLRGTLRSGDLEEALQVFEEMKKLQIKPDGSSYEYLIKNFCQSLKLDEALEMADLMSPKNASVCASLATALAVVGKTKQARKFTKEAREILESGSENAISFDEDLNQKKEGGEENAEGKQQRSSVPLFLQHRKDELTRECDRVDLYLSTLDEKKKSKKEKELVFPDPEKVFILPESKRNKEFKERLGAVGKKLKLEVCSGHGDWIVERAKNEPKIHWVGLEMRYERVFQIWSRALFQGVDNISIIGGEGHQVLRASVPDEVFDEIFVNYPDPPVWEGSKQKLIDHSFLKHAHRTLKKGCSLTLVTDDDGYCQTMLKELSQVPEFFQSAFGEQTYLDEVPKGYGSSYFDRFWTNGNKSERFYMKFVKV